MSKKFFGTRVQSLDALKFFASMLILFHHFHQCFGQGNMGISFYEGGVYCIWQCSRIIFCTERNIYSIAK